MQNRKQKAATRKIDPLAFLDEIAKNFKRSKTHCWNNDEKPTTVQSTIFVLKLIIFYAKNPKTPFIVSNSTFYNLTKTPVSELRAIKECMSKKFLVAFSEGKGIKCWYSGKELMFQRFSGLNMLSIDQGDPSMKSDDHGQTWYVCSWGINRLKGNASSQQLRRYLEELQGILLDHVV